MKIIGIFGGYACLGLSFLIVFEIFGRHFLNYSMQSVDEIGGYVVAITGTVGMALAAWHRSHTRIDILLTRLPVPVRALLNVLAYAMLSGGAIFMASMAWSTLAETLEFKSVASTPLQTPLWIPQSMWFAGLAVFALTSVVMTAKGVKQLTVSWHAADRYLAPTSLQQTIEGRLSDAELAAASPADTAPLTATKATTDTATDTATDKSSKTSPSSKQP